MLPPRSNMHSILPARSLFVKKTVLVIQGCCNISFSPPTRPKKKETWEQPLPGKGQRPFALPISERMPASFWLKEDDTQERMPPVVKTRKHLALRPATSHDLFTYLLSAVDNLEAPISGAVPPLPPHLVCLVHGHTLPRAHMLQPLRPPEGYAP